MVGLRIKAVLWWFVYLYPIIPLLLIHGCWAITTFSLGSPPVFGEIPKHDFSNAACVPLGVTAALLSVAWPLFVPTGLLWCFFQPFAQLSKVPTIANRIVCLSIYALMLAAAAAISFRDPVGAIYWFWD